MMYNPREDSYALEKYVKRYAHGKVLDLGTGSGIQAEAALKNTRDVLAADINPEAVAFVEKKGIHVIQSDLFSNVKGTFDVIIFNPPYLPEIENEDQQLAQAISGGKHGHELLERFLQQATKHLNTNGKVLLVCSSLTGNVEELFRKHRYTFKKLEEKSYLTEEIKVYLLQ